MTISGDDDGHQFALPGLKGRVAVVTGAENGIGREITLTLAALGAIAVPTDLEAPNIEGVATGFAMDVRDEDSVEAAFTSIEQRYGPASIVVANAGIVAQGPLVETSLEDWNEIFRVNVTGVFLTLRRAAPAMVSAGYGRIIAIASSAARNGGQTKPMAAYATSKGAVATMVQTLARELKRTGVTVNGVLPAAIDTRMNTGRNDLQDLLLVERGGRPSDIANATAFLASGAAEYMTGELMDVNGGFVID